VIREEGIGPRPKQVGSKPAKLCKGSLVANIASSDECSENGKIPHFLVFGIWPCKLCRFLIVRSWTDRMIC